jgi:hypothetical protein
MDGWPELIVTGSAVIVGALIALAATLTGALINRRGTDRKVDLDEQQRQRERHDEYVREIRELAVALITSVERYLRDCQDVLIRPRNISSASLTLIEAALYRIQDASQLFQLSSEASDANELARDVELHAVLLYSMFAALPVDPTDTKTVQEQQRMLQSTLIKYKEEVRTAFASSAQSEERRLQIELDRERNKPEVEKLMKELEKPLSASDDDQPPAREADNGKR